MKYERILAAAAGTPWAVTADKAALIAGFLARKAAGETIPAAEIEAAKESAKSARKGRAGAVALLPIYGTITQRADLMSDWSGGTSTEAVGNWLDEAIAEPSVEAVVLDVDSAGGSVYGIEELAQKIHASSKRKKVIAVANSQAASAAYWLASQASELVVTPNGQIGSLGVFVMHVDRSEMVARDGQKVTYVSAGERKTAGNPYGPLDESGRAELQSGVDDYYDKFVRAVARGRNATLSAVRDGFGRGGMVRAEAAVREGMADRIGTLESVLSRYGLSIAETASPALDRRRRSLLD